MVNFYEIFSREKRDIGRKRLQEEMKRGHFDDFKQLRDTQGKLFRGSPKLLPGTHPSSSSSLFSRVDVVDGVTKESISLMEAFSGGERGGKKKAILLAVACRDGAQPMLDAWVRGWTQAMTDSTYLDDRGHIYSKMGLLELSVVDSVVMGLAPFRTLLFGKVRETSRGIDAKTAFMFTHSKGYNQVLESLENRLIGFVYLLDSNGSIRWRGCGFPDEDELLWLANATRTLLMSET
jgi:ATPase complex subunit ATP10